MFPDACLPTDPRACHVDNINRRTQEVQSGGSCHVDNINHCTQEVQSGGSSFGSPSPMIP